MWIARLLVYDENGMFASRAKKFNVGIHGYMLNYYSTKNSLYYTVLAFIEGTDKLKKKFITDLKKEKNIENIEDEGNFIICRAKVTLDKERQYFIKLFYNPLLIQMRPYVIYTDGWEELELASFDRKHLEEILKVSEKHFNLKLKYIRKEKIANLGILSMLPKLTEKQKIAVESAISNGYYEYPRRIDVLRLAKKSNLSFSTFQEHLRKAENKLIPFAIKKSD